MLSDLPQGEVKWLLRQLALFLLLRDEIVREAHQAGLSKSQIFEETGLARTTVDRIIGTVDAKGLACDHCPAPCAGCPKWEDHATS
jgi:DNA-binding IclR family transcriptional regulator